MRAVTMTGPGGPEVLRVEERPDPEPAPGEVLVEVAASAVNRADLLQRQGNYPPPPGAPDILGLECSGTIAALGDDVSDRRVGDQVCALLAGGGYAERVAVPAGQVMPLPTGVDLVTAAALPEVACTVWSNLVQVARLQSGETLLVHGGAGGIGTFAIQLAVARGARVIATAGSPEKVDVCRSLGAKVAIDYRELDFVEEVRTATEGRGADVILDVLGASYLTRNLQAIALNGRLVVIGLQGGGRAELDLGRLLTRRASVHGTTLRSRPAAEKAAICAGVVTEVWPLVAAGRVRAVVDRVLPLDDVAAAHALVERSGHVGKVVLAVGTPGVGDTT